MTDDRMGGVALIAGAVGMIMTMRLHPSGHDLFVPGQFATMARLAVAAHALALATVPVFLPGSHGAVALRGDPGAALDRGSGDVCARAAGGTMMFRREGS